MLLGINLITCIKLDYFGGDPQAVKEEVEEEGCEDKTSRSIVLVF
jgi:hypothetical protein